MFLNPVTQSDVLNPTIMHSGGKAEPVLLDFLSLVCKRVITASSALCALLCLAAAAIFIGSAYATPIQIGRVRERHIAPLV